MKHKVSELNGALLDAAVAMSAGAKLVGGRVALAGTRKHWVGG